MSTSPLFSVNIACLLTLDQYKSLTASQLCADPFFQEWVFHPLGKLDSFFLDVLISHSVTSWQMQMAKSRLVQFSNSCDFIGHCIQCYSRMKQQLRGHNTEENFIIVQEYWNNIQEILLGYEFESNAIEIHFFKWIKSLFTGEREYYSLLHHAELFSTADEKFWQRQPVKLEKLMNENKNVIDAYINGETRYDEWWYCRGEFKDRTVHDETIGNYLGMLRYLKYAETQI